MKAASRLPQVFGSAPGVTTPEPACWAGVVSGSSTVRMDGGEHAGLRRTVSRAFAPRLLAAAGEGIAATARRLVDETHAERPADFMRSAATRLPFELGGTRLRAGRRRLPGGLWDSIEGRPGFPGAWAAWRKAAGTGCPCRAPRCRSGARGAFRTGKCGRCFGRARTGSWTGSRMSTSVCRPNVWSCRGSRTR
ncbi:hypothetical protein GCM10010327_42390 [Streptomyces nitrosporeus]|nr:hypothetical protein GCM10010327_42390 [Streptomyces nitrosporeus]